MIQTQNTIRKQRTALFNDPLFGQEFGIGEPCQAKAFVDQAIAEAIDSSAIWRELSEDSPQVYLCIRNFILSEGKRMRPLLFYLFYRAMTSDFEPGKIMKTMAAMEMIHTFILIHDDIIDKSENRRCGRTLNSLFSSLLSSSGEKSPIRGEDLALVAGDMLYAFAVDIFNQAGFDGALISLLMQKLSGTALMTAHGEFREILATTRRIDELTQDAVTRIYDLKTSYYTFTAPVSIASLISGREINNLCIESFTLPLGRAFQLRNDIKEIAEARESKEVPKDFIEKKRTLPLLWAYSSSGLKGREMISCFLRKEKVSMEDYLGIREIFMDTKTIEKAENEIHKLTNTALFNIMKLDADQDYLKLIESYITHIIKPLTI